MTGSSRTQVPPMAFQRATITTVSPLADFQSPRGKANVATLDTTSSPLSGCHFGHAD